MQQLAKSKIVKGWILIGGKILASVSPVYKGRVTVCHSTSSSVKRTHHILDTVMYVGKI